MWQTGGNRYKLKKSLGNGYVFTNRATLRSSTLSTSFDVIKPMYMDTLVLFFLKAGRLTNLSSGAMSSAYRHCALRDLIDWLGVITSVVSLCSYELI
jgi:hypothetical protein